MVVIIMRRAARVLVAGLAELERMWDFVQSLEFGIWRDNVIYATWRDNAI